MPVSKTRNHFQYPGLVTNGLSDHESFGFPLGDEEVAVFVSVPFCRVRCHECPFFSSYLPPRSRRAETFDRYFSAVGDHVGAVAESGVLNRRGAVYVGGGTPSAVDPSYIVGVLDRLHAAGLSITELTVEANPEDVSPEWVAALREAGVARISLGVQSPFEDRLKVIGSPHTLLDTERAIDAVHAMDALDLNVDLLYGVPGQTERELRRQADWALNAGATSITWYAYTFRPVGILPPSKRALHRTPPEATPETEKASAYIQIREQMEAAGLAEQMNGAFFRQGHTLRYSRLAYFETSPLIGFGARAYSFNGERLAQCDILPDAYVAASQNASQRYVRASPLLAANHLRIRKTLFGVMFGEITKELADDWRASADAARFSAICAEWSARGWVERRDGALHLTVEGLAHGDALLDALWNVAEGR